MRFAYADPPVEGERGDVARHAPGPWRIETPADELLKFQIHCIGERPTMEIWADGKHAAGGFYQLIALVADNDFANARLIAAAPDMYAQHCANAAVLEYLVNAIDANEPLTVEMFDKIVACHKRSQSALAKVRGA